MASCDYVGAYYNFGSTRYLYIRVRNIPRVTTQETTILRIIDISL
jgi:hypothetical protein